MKAKGTFDILLLIARPAAGKSEIIDYLKNVGIKKRIERFHIGEFEEIDDFPMLWTWFEEDAILTGMEYPRLHTNEDDSFIGQHLWNLLIKRICLEYGKKLREHSAYHDRFTTIIEFSRGKEHGGYASAFEHLDQDMLRKMAILYVNVSWEESLRKNRERFNPERPGSILEHGLTEENLKRLYMEIDWEDVSAGEPEHITIQGVRVPYVIFENEDDLTTERGNELGLRLEETLSHLWFVYQASQTEK